MTIPDSSQGLPVIGSELNFWGVPGDPSHDGDRGGPFEGTVRPFLSNPTSCTGPVLTSLRMNSWQEPNNYQEASFLSHNAANEPVGADGCDKLSFEPSVNMQSDPPSAASPTALSATLHVPQHNSDPEGLVSSHLKKAVVKLPQGVTVNPAAANGLGGCSEAQFGYNNANPVSCPTIRGSARAKSSARCSKTPPKGSIYLAQQNANPFGSLLAIYMVVEAKGVTVKIAGKIDTDPSTGQVTATFDDNPQLPFSDFRLNFFGGPGGVLVNPNDCGDKTYTSFDQLLVGRHGERDRLVQHQPELLDGRLQPGLLGRDRPASGGRLRAVRARRDPQRRRTERLRDRHDPAEGPRGEDRRRAALPGGKRRLGSCPATSQVGSVSIAAGAGPNPVWVPQPGKAPTAVYLGGPYKGDPYSLIFRAPVQAGPFDLGTVALRASISVNPETAQVSVASDGLPQILQGIPIDYRQIHIDVNRAGFTLNPTNCNEQAVASTIVSDSGAAVTPASRFQVGSCGNLGLKPKLFTRIWGKTNRGAHPKFRAVLEERNGDANLGRVALTLPRSEFLDQAHIKTICTRVQFAANACPADSVYGWAKARTPLFDQMFEGPVYLRSSNNKLPDLVAALKGPVAFNLVGRIDSVNKGIRNTFESPPDVPVSKFILYLKGGSKGLLVNSRNICNQKYRSNANLRGQNGRKKTLKPVLKNNRCKKGKKK